MSSTETEASDEPLRFGIGPVKLKPKAKSKRRSSKPISQSGKKVARSSDEFLKEFACKLSDASRCHRGCLHCGFQCFQKMQRCLDDLVRWRDEFKQLPVPAQEKELLWIFRNCRPLSQNPAAKRPVEASEGDSTETECSGQSKPVLLKKRRKLSRSSTDTSHPSVGSSESEPVELDPGPATKKMKQSGPAALKLPGRKHTEKRVPG